MTDINYTNKDGIEPAAGYNSYNIRKTDNDDYFDNGNVIEQDELAPSGGGVDPSQFTSYHLYYTIVDEDAGTETDPELIPAGEYFPNPLIVMKDQLALLSAPPITGGDLEFIRWIVRDTSGVGEDYVPEEAKTYLNGNVYGEYQYLDWDVESDGGMVIAQTKMGGR